MYRILFVVLLVLVAPVDAQAAFECYGGDRPACLNWGDKVCSSTGKCVDDNAVCFDSYACDFKGFVCKSTLDRLADDYETLLRKAKIMAFDYDEERRCVTEARSLQEAQDCVR